MAYSLEAWRVLSEITATLGLDPERYSRLADLEARYWGIDKADRPEWYIEDDCDGKAISVEFKAPSRRYNLAQRATNDVVSLVLGTMGGPALGAEREGGDGADDATTDALQLLADHSAFAAALKMATVHLVATGGAAMTLRPDAIPASRITWDYHPARHCIPVFGDDDPEEARRIGAGPHDLIRLRILYAYSVHDARRTQLGMNAQRWFIFRRDFDDKAIVDFAPVEITATGLVGGGVGPSVASWPSVAQERTANGGASGRGPTLQERMRQAMQAAVDGARDAMGANYTGDLSNPGGIWKESARVVHGLGKVPAVWLRSEVIAHDSEGPGLFEGAKTLLDAQDLRLSQLDESVGYNLDPIPVISGHNRDPRGSVELRRGAGYCLELPTSVGMSTPPSARYLEINGAAHESGRQLLTELRAMATEVMRVHIRREGEGGGALSGTAIRLQQMPMISLVTEYRKRLEVGIQAACEVMLLAGLKWRASLQIIGGALPAGFRVTTIGMIWPPIYPPTSEEVAQLATSMSQITAAGLLSKQTAVRITCAALGIQDVEGELAKLEEESESAMQTAREMMAQRAELGGGASEGAGAGAGGEDPEEPDDAEELSDDATEDATGAGK